MKPTKKSTVTFGNGDPFVIVPNWDTEKQKEIEELLGSNKFTNGPLVALKSGIEYVTETLTYIEDYPKSAGFYFIIGVKDDGQIDGPEVAENKMTNIGWFLYGSEIAYCGKYDKLFYAGPITTPEIPKI